MSDFQALERSPRIRPEALDPDRYFLSLLEEAVRLEIIPESRAETIQTECAALLAERTKRFTAGDSLSVTVERAKSLLESSLYTVGAYLETFSPDLAAETLLTQPVALLFEKGRKAVDAQYRRAKNLLSSVHKNLVPTENIAYNDTLSNGIPPFFRKYDRDYEAHNIPASIDYPLCELCGPCRGRGAAYILEYLRRVYLENKLCLWFPPPLTDAVLRGDDPRFRHLLVNLFEAVLINALGCVLTGSDPLTLNPPRDSLPLLRERLLRLDRVQAVLLLREASARLLQRMDLTEAEEYVLTAAEAMAPLLLDGAAKDQLAQIFPVPAKSKEHAPAVFQDNPAMDTEQFRAFFRELRSCRHSADRVVMLRRLRSLEDLTDALSAGALGPEEYPPLFGALDDSVLGLLARALPTDFDSMELHFTANEEEWLRALQSHLDKLDVSRREQILALAQSFSAI